MAAYLDDLLICSDSYPQMLERLELVFKKLREAKLRLNPEKCRFCFENTRVVGFLAGRSGLQPDPEKVEAITQIPYPKTVRDVRSFLGAVNFFWRFIKNFSTIAKPLTRLTKSDILFNFGEEEKQAFNSLKKALCEQPVLAILDPKLPTELHTDAAEDGMGATLLQVRAGVKNVIAYFSRTLTAPERNYSIPEKEYLALVQAVSHFHQYLADIKFIVYTDSCFTCFLRQSRLRNYDFEIKHISGRCNVFPDYLSRHAIKELSDEERRLRENPLSVNAIVIDKTKDFIAAQQRDYQIREIIQKKLTDPTAFEVRFYEIQDGILYRKLGKDYRVVIPKNLIREILHEVHSHPFTGAHQGFNKTFMAAKERYYWSGMAADIRSYIRSCRECQESNENTARKQGLLYPLKVNHTFERISLDILGPVRENKGSRYNHSLRIPKPLCHREAFKKLLRQVRFVHSSLMMCSLCLAYLVPY